ncbi:MAG: DUF58 domain-containing protein [Candidatus Hydrogenedentes bacterium]|nr:DUF58 domain-containing protein [Candidatus Hydrogenedentota bacterium]
MDSTTIPASVMAQIQRIRIRTQRIVNDMLSGEYESVFKGSGMIFKEVREYVPGDDVRSIDWNVTARTGHPHVKVMTEEHEQTVMLVVDASASGRFGSGVRFKSELAAELGAVLAYSAIKNNDRVGLLIFTDEVELFVRPQKGRKHVLRVIREILCHTPGRRGTDLAKALDYLNQVVKRHAIVFIISDFMVSDYETALRMTRRKHDTIAVAIDDIREAVLPDVGVVAVRDAETGEETIVDTGLASLRAAYADEAQRRIDARRTLLERLRVDLISLEVEEDYVRALHRFFRMRERRLLA